LYWFVFSRQSSPIEETAAPATMLKKPQLATFFCPSMRRDTEAGASKKTQGTQDKHFISRNKKPARTGWLETAF
jgi:hypothetical protein